MRLFLLLSVLVQLIAAQDCGKVCELDAFGQKLSYPGAIAAATLYATTTNVIVYEDLNGEYIATTSVQTAAPPPKPTITWEVSGVALTYPNTYVIYKSLVHSFVVSEGSCSTGASSLVLGPSTNYASLIYPASEITGTLPPSGLINYIEGIPTAMAQLGGHVNSSCDPTTASAFASAPTVTLTTTNFIPSATASTTTQTISAQFQTMSNSVLTVTPRFKNTTTTVPVPGPSTTTTSTVSSIISTSSSTVSSLSVTTTTTSTSTPSSAISSSSSSSAISSTSATSSTESPTSSSSTSSTTLTKTSVFPITSTKTSITSVSLTHPTPSTTVTFSGPISSIEKTTPPAPSTPSGGLPSGANGTGIATATVVATFTGLANRFADGAYVGTGGFLAGVLGLAAYWL